MSCAAVRCDEMAGTALGEMACDGMAWHGSGWVPMALGSFRGGGSGLGMAAAADLGCGEARMRIGGDRRRVDGLRADIAVGKSHCSLWLSLICNCRAEMVSFSGASNCSGVGQLAALSVFGAVRLVRKWAGPEIIYSVCV